MWLVLTAMRRPITILVAVMSVALASIVAIRQMKVDIFPKLGAPAIYVAQPYGGMDPSQMEGYLTYYYEMKAMDVITGLVGAQNVEITTGFIGVQPPNYPINTIYLFTSGQHEAVVGVALKPGAPPVTEALKEQLRHQLKKALPDVSVSFEAADI